MRGYKYSDFQDVLLRIPVDEEEYGIFQFQRGDDPNPIKDVFFFFKKGGSRKKGAKELHGYVQNRVIRAAEEKVIREQKAREAQDALITRALQSSQKAPQMSAPDELMKWKQLLDAGAISQQEYDAKKTQLLGL